MAASKEAVRYWRAKQITHVTDTQWGDTGKGKLTDAGAQDMVIRVNGGANAGHTVNNEYGEFKVHILPSGFANPETTCIVGQGAVVDVAQFVKEFKEIKQRVPQPATFFISNKSHMVMPWHKEQDKLREQARGNGNIGTTCSGNGPAYAERANRTGLRVGDLLSPNFAELLREELPRQERLARLMAGELLLSEVFHELGTDIFSRTNGVKKEPYFNYEQILADLLEAREVIAPMISNVIPKIQEFKREGKQILGEAGQGSLLDLDFGGYPYVTSSHPGIIGFMLSTGIQAKDIDRVLGSTKAYTTRVGRGPLPTEQENETGKHLLTVGGEIGTTTGRPRRCGWFDVVATKYGAETAGVTNLALTKLDVLDDLDEIKMCVAYTIDGQCYKELEDTDPAFMERAIPVYETFKGWEQSTKEVREYNDLPPEAKVYISAIEDKIGLPVDIVSVGKYREQTIYRTT